jgi:hypothetical protein
VSELDHLETKPSGTQTPCGQYDKRPDNHSPTRPLQSVR